ncbi:hypothetical protein PspLS_03526 [Pyricularia sp. CBS 133598]|nr:hypothetical protein PspLS_03526 [Pyricularia sp. CBS 133598]
MLKNLVCNVLISGGDTESCSVIRSPEFSLLLTGVLPCCCRSSRLLFCVFENGLAASWQGHKPALHTSRP